MVGAFAAQQVSRSSAEFGMDPGPELVGVTFLRDVQELRDAGSVVGHRKRLYAWLG